MQVTLLAVEFVIIVKVLALLPVRGVVMLTAVADSAVQTSWAVYKLAHV
jgi:hypothetical protein